MDRTFVLATDPTSTQERCELGLGLSDVMVWDTERPYHYARWTADHRLLLVAADSTTQPEEPPGRSNARILCAPLCGYPYLRRSRGATRMVRFAVVGLGHIAQVAVIPAFAHARRNSKLVAIVSGDRTKRREIAKRYRLTRLRLRRYDECLRLVDAVYIALPNSMHAEYAIRAARAGVHVLCEKPMAVTVEECRQMIRAADKAHVKLMIAYRLHFEALNLAAIDLHVTATSATSSSSTHPSP